MNPEAQKLTCFDLDGTLTLVGSSWEAFNARLGITPDDDKRLFEKYVAGNHSYKEWLMELMAIYKEGDAVTKHDIEALAESMELRPGACEIIEAAKEKGYHVVLISGSIDTITRVCAAKVHIGEWFAANKAIFNEDNELVGIEGMGDERDAKLLLLQEYALKNGIQLKDVICVEDGGNGLELFKHAKGILLGDNVELAPFAWKQVQSLEDVGQYL